MLSPPLIACLFAPLLSSPWNSHGYDIAKKFALKFTHISPCWYQIKLSSKHTPPAPGSGKKKGKLQISVDITGGHDADIQWIRDVQEAGSNHETQTRVGVVPRFILEPDSAELYLKLAEKEALQRVIIDKICAEIARTTSDGIVLEMSPAWSFVSSRSRDPKSRNGLNLFLMRLAEEMHHAFAPEAKQLFLVVRPMRDGSMDFQHFDFQQTHRFVDGYSLMVSSDR